MIDFDTNIKNAIKSKNLIATTVYRNLKTEIQKYETSKNAKPLTDDKQLEIISKYSKNLEDSISQFKQAHRDDLVAQYTSELDIVKQLIPEPPTSLELKKFIVVDKYFNKYNIPHTIDIQGIKTQIPKKNMGECIKYIKSKFPTADGKLISQVIKEYIV